MSGLTERDRLSLWSAGYRAAESWLLQRALAAAPDDAMGATRHEVVLAKLTRAEAAAIDLEPFALLARGFVRGAPWWPSGDRQPHPSVADAVWDEVRAGFVEALDREGWIEPADGGAAR